MKIKADKTIVSQKEVLQWRKDFLRLIEIVHDTKPTDFLDALRQQKKLDQMFRTFFGTTVPNSMDTGSGIQQWLDFHVLRQPASKLAGTGGLKSKLLQPLLDKFENVTLNQVDFRPGWYVERKYQTPELRKWGIDLFRLHDFQAIVSPTAGFKRAVEYVDKQPNIKEDLATEFRSVDFTGSIKAANKFFDTVRDFIGLMGEGDKKGAKEIKYDTGIHPEYKAFNLTFINKAMLSEDTFDEVVQKLAPFLNRLKKFIPEILYGGVILLPEEGYNFALKDGSGDSKAAAHYAPNDTIVVYCVDYGKFPSSFGTLMVHELGHRYYRKKMDASDRAKWGEFFKKGSPASKYGSTDPEEDFCESLAAYIGEKAGKSLPTGYEYFLSQDIFDKLEAIVGRRLTAQVENFYGDFTAAVANKSLMQIKKGNEFDLAYDRNRKEFWITKDNEPVYRSGTSGYSAIVREWNSRVQPSYTIIEQWLTDQLKDKENEETLTPWQNLDTMKIGATIIRGKRV